MYFQDGVFVLKAPEIYPDNPENRKFPRKFPGWNAQLRERGRKKRRKKSKRGVWEMEEEGEGDVVQSIDGEEEEEEAVEG